MTFIFVFSDAKAEFSAAITQIFHCHNKFWLLSMLKTVVLLNIFVKTMAH